MGILSHITLYATTDLCDSIVKLRMSVKPLDIPVYWDQPSTTVREDAGTLTITLRRDVPAEEAIGVIQQVVSVAGLDGTLKV